MAFNFTQICTDLLKDLTPKQKEIIWRRFGLKKGASRETLEAIGKTHGITRERVRQIEEAGFLKLKPKLEKYKAVFQHFTSQFNKSGGLKKEDGLLDALGGSGFQNQVFFLLTVSEPYTRFHENKNYYSLWSLNANVFSQAQKIVATLYKKLNQDKKPFLLKDCKTAFPNLTSEALGSFLEISKQILKNQEGFYGLKSWPEINPRGVRDKAYLVLRKEKKPLHFAEISRLIEDSLVPTVHNELIKDPRFILVGRGMYALDEWGYFPGQVKDVILQTLKDAKKPLTKEEILQKVLKQRMVQQNTILLNLTNKKYFFKNPQGKYWIKEA